MKNILVTGSNGFIGKNFLKKLIFLNVNILEFNRNNNEEELREFIIKSDYIFHFAGEVRPNIDDISLEKSNTVLTEKIIQILNDNNKKVPILFTSSIHAKTLKNKYGITKRESEILIEKYSYENNVGSCIYRLPHIFGEECKPNYNSVITTWIYNKIRNLDISVFDRDIKMKYIYIQDITDEMLLKLNNIKVELEYCEPKVYFDTTLGEVVDYINEFKNDFDEDKCDYENNEFKKKLFMTYQFYLNKFNQS